VRIIGLTGGIASGKSTVARMLREQGAVVVDADALSREAVAPGSEALAAIVAAFGPEVLAADGTLDRKAVAARVFSDAISRARLNAIVHPEVARLSREAFARAEADGHPIVFYEAALLVENGVHTGLDGLVVVAAPPEVQRARLATRDGLSDAEADLRLAAQLPLERKLAVATHVIHNDDDLAHTRRAVEALWKELT
jgi:dephospho-CoA kinase